MVTYEEEEECMEEMDQLVDIEHEEDSEELQMLELKTMRIAINVSIVVLCVS